MIDIIQIIDNTLNPNMSFPFLSRLKCSLLHVFAMHLLMSYEATFHSLRFLFVENLKSFDAMLEDSSYNVK